MFLHNFYIYYLQLYFDQRPAWSQDQQGAQMYSIWLSKIGEGTHYTLSHCAQIRQIQKK